MTAEEVYKERYGKERSDQGHGGFFACGVYGCNYIGKTYAHLSLHCALSHFCSHYDIPITSIRASDPMEATKHHSNSGKVGKALAQSTIMNTPISRWSLPPLQDKMDDSKGSSFRPMLLDPMFSPSASIDALSPTLGLKEGEKLGYGVARIFERSKPRKSVQTWLRWSISCAFMATKLR